MTRDPIEYEGGIKLYGDVRNNPANIQDVHDPGDIDVFDSIESAERYLESIDVEENIRLVAFDSVSGDCFGYYQQFHA